MPKNQTSNALSVTELNQKARRMLEVSLGSILVEGEISNFSKPSSGHCYFTLKDDAAQVRCAMFRHRAQSLIFTPKEGDLVQVRGKVSLYENRGDYQLLVDSMTQSGDGALRQAYDQLKIKLQHKGLFAPEHKQPIPTNISHIGVITSPTGAAIQDIISVLKRRFPAIEISIYPCAVQGQDASREIVKAIENANRDNHVDVLILGRGGGSLEDLWSFNEENVAHAIYNSKLPIVSAVGHETDVSISDYVADVRAPTPSAAAEILSPNQAEWLNSIQSYEDYFVNKIRHDIQQLSQKTTWLFKRLRHPNHQLQEQSQRLDQLEIRLLNATAHHFKTKKHHVDQQQSLLWKTSPAHQIEQQKLHLNNIQQRISASIKQQIQEKQHQLQQKNYLLWQFNPQQFIQQQAQNINNIRQRMNVNIKHQFQQAHQKLANTSHNLQTVSPLSTLARGYGIVQRNDKTPITSTSNVNKGDKIITRLHQGKLECTVDKITK